METLSTTKAHGGTLDFARPASGGFEAAIRLPQRGVAQ